jgi:hypothetical protein
MRVGFLTASVLCSATIAQPGATPAPPASQPATIKFEDLPPAARLGIRAEGVRRQSGVVPTVVIVPDTSSYVAAVAKWDVVVREGKAPGTRWVGVRYPVLIDDGTWQAREDIARFVRAFQPTSVVRWSASTQLPKEEAGFKGAVEQALASVWGAASVSELGAKWKAMNFAPPGIVAASPDDPAWTAALALAAGHGQPLAWIAAKPDLAGSMGMDEAVALNAAVMEACRATGYTWEGLGDDIEAVTLCVSASAVVRASAGDSRKTLAMTDIVGRGAGGDAERRWAWASQVMGSSSRAGYSAMCALFLEPSRAWLFDGYAPGPPKTTDGKQVQDPRALYDASAAALSFEKAGVHTVVNDNGNQGAIDWRNRAAGMGLTVNTDPKREAASGVDVGFIAVNTSGHPEQFEVAPGQLRSSDVPFLHVPAAVHFVHSFSAASPGNRATIAGRFLERGAYAYVGAVHEPFLQAFIPTPRLVERLLAPGPWGACVRLDDAPTWKVAVFGDPLMTLGPAAPRVETPLPLEGPTSLRDALAPALKEKKYEEALWLLAMQGRDADAARLVRLVEKDDSAALTPGVALAGVMAVFRSPGREGAMGTGERLTLLANLCLRLEKEYPSTPELRDILWHAAYPLMNSLNESHLRALAGAIRPEQASYDATELARVTRFAKGAGTGPAMLKGLKGQIPDFASKALDDALAK